LDQLGTTVITSYENNHFEDTVEEGNHLSYDDDSVSANQAPTSTGLEHTNMPDDGHDDQSTQDTSIPVEIAGVEASPFIRHSAWVIRKPERIIETHMLKAKGFHRVHLMIYEANIETNIEHFKPLNDNTGMNALSMTQHSMKKGLKIFGQRGVDTLINHLRQLDTRKVLDPVHGRLLSKEDRKTLNYLMFLKEKRTGIIKGRGCADGRKQQSLITKENASSPTVSLESLLLTCAIDAMERRYVAKTDIPGAFMHADMDELVHIRFEGTLAELLIRSNPSLYRKHVFIERGKPGLYAKLAKAIYGTLRAALLFWNNLTQTLINCGFELDL
jgi:hypothetical protein